MSRILAVVGIVVLGLLSARLLGDERGKTNDARRIALEAELADLRNFHGESHPDVLAAKNRIAMLQKEEAHGKEINPKGLLAVISKEKVAATLKDARVRMLGDRSFVVGLEVEGQKITKGSYVGKTVWIPLDDVIEMIELEDPKAK